MIAKCLHIFCDSIAAGIAAWNHTLCTFACILSKPADHLYRNFRWAATSQTISCNYTSTFRMHLSRAYRVRLEVPYPGQIVLFNNKKSHFWTVRFLLMVSIKCKFANWKSDRTAQCLQQILRSAQWSSQSCPFAPWILPIHCSPSTIYFEFSIFMGYFQSVAINLRLYYMLSFHVFVQCIYVWRARDHTLIRRNTYMLTERWSYVLWRVRLMFLHYVVCVFFLHRCCCWVYLGLDRL